jgi:cyclopropane-fatty-acyl-phospholipid synthase
MAVTHKQADMAAAEVRAASTTERILDRLFSPHRPFTTRLWNGATFPSAGKAQFTLVLTHPGALRKMLLPPTELAAGESFVRGDFDVEGDLEAAVGVMAQAALSKSLRDWLQVGSWALTLPRTAVDGTVPARARLSGRRHSLARDRSAVRHHYDVGNDFYAVWLGRRLVYSCAYFQTGTEDIDAAQEAKLEHICRKLRLRPGERVLDIGCGWGGLVRYAAAHYGVRAVGVTLSEPQAQYAQEQIRADGLQGRAEVRVADYREIADKPFDKLVSVGMFEHVGRARLPEYFRKAWDLLRPGGLFLNHGIAARPSIVIRRTRALGPTFMQAHVFPDGELEPIADTLVAAEAVGFEVRDVENLREHYAQTLRLWRRALEAGARRAVDLVGEGRYRTWRLFLAASAQGFASGRTEVFQALLARPDASGAVDLPWSRAHLYT